MGCDDARSCVRTGRWFGGSSVSECCTGHWVGDSDADFDKDAWSTGQLAAEDEGRELFAREAPNWTGSSRSRRRVDVSQTPIDPLDTLQRTMSWQDTGRTLAGRGQYIGLDNRA